MKIEILTSVAGARFSYGPGLRDIGDGPGQIPEKHAFELLRDGIARAVKTETETATTAAPEAAVTRGRSNPGGPRNRSKPNRR